MLGPALPRFRECYLQLSVDLRLGDRIVATIDVTISVGELAAFHLMSRRLAPNRACTLASPAYPARRGMPQHPDELVRHDCVNVHLQNSGCLLRWSFRISARMIEIMKAGITVDNSDGVLAELAVGAGSASRPRTSPHPMSSAAKWGQSVQSSPWSARASQPYGPRAGAAVRT
uniref:LysR substrate-binding domain-containing protein n=1 Tax=Microvirga lenta TaxID=2881337 RepID=UPI00384D8F47